MKIEDSDAKEIARDAVALVLATHRQDLETYRCVLQAYPQYEDLTYLSIMICKFVLRAMQDYLEVADETDFTIDQLLQALALQMAADV